MNETATFVQTASTLQDSARISSTTTAERTTNTPTETTTNTPVYIGVGVGIFVVFVIVFGIVLYRLRQKRKQRERLRRGSVLPDPHDIDRSSCRSEGMTLNDAQVDRSLSPLPEPPEFCGEITRNRQQPPIPVAGSASPEEANHNVFSKEISRRGKDNPNEREVPPPSPTNHIRSKPNYVNTGVNSWKENPELPLLQQMTEWSARQAHLQTVTEKPPPPHSAPGKARYVNTGVDKHLHNPDLVTDNKWKADYVNIRKELPDYPNL